MMPPTAPSGWGYPAPGIFTQQDLWKSPPACSGTFYFALSDTAAYHAAVKDQASIAWPLEQCLTAQSSSV